MQLQDTINQQGYEELSEHDKLLYVGSKDAGYNLDIDVDSIINRTGYKQKITDSQGKLKELNSKLGVWEKLGKFEDVSKEMEALRSAKLELEKKISALSDGQGSNFEKQIADFKASAEKEATEQLVRQELKWKETLSVRESDIASLQAKLEAISTETSLRAIVQSTTPKMRPERFEAFTKIYMSHRNGAARFKIDSNNQLSLLDADSMPSIKSVKTFIEEEVKKEYPEWFEGSVASGSGATSWNVEPKSQEKNLREQLVQARKAGNSAEGVRITREIANLQKSH